MFANAASLTGSSLASSTGSSLASSVAGTFSSSLDWGAMTFLLGKCVSIEGRTYPEGTSGRASGGAALAITIGGASDGASTSGDSVFATCTGAAET